MRTSSTRPRRGVDARTASDAGRGLDNGSGSVVRDRLGGRTARPAARAPRKMRVVVAMGATADPVAKGGSGLTHGRGETNREPLTTVRVARNGRGLTSGWGMVNGTGMVREADHLRSVGRFNGSCAVYRGAALGTRDGMTNGSGLTMATGLADDAGLTNGCGLTHGEGMTNGCGLVTPIDHLVPAPTPPAASRRGSFRRALGI